MRDRHARRAACGHARAGQARTAAFVAAGIALVAGVGIAAIDEHGVGDDATLGRLQHLEQFEGLDPERFADQLFVDPYFGDDRNPGTYEAPLRSLRAIKRHCLDRPAMRCTVKGLGRVFSPRTLTVQHGSSARFVVGEAVTTGAPDAEGVVVGADGDLLVLSISTPPTNTWGASPTAPEPRVATVVIGATSGAVATVVDFEDTIVGLHSVLFGPGDVTVASPARIHVAGHGYADGDGPLVWLNETTLPATSDVGLVEGLTRLWVCDATADGFALALAPDCGGARLGVTDAGAGLSQLVAYSAFRYASDTGLAANAAISMRCDPSERHRMCSVFESEFPDSPWTIDGGGFYLNELRAVVHPAAWPGAESGGTYNPPGGHLLGVRQVTPDLSQGWLGVQNGVVQNIALDAISVMHGGKLVALNVEVHGIRNGTSDRSQEGMPSPPWQAHNSCIQVTGTSTVPDNTGSIGYWINVGDSWSYQGSHIGSGGCVNANKRGVLRILSRGAIHSDAFPGDTACDGGPCRASLIVNPHADVTVVGPLELWMGSLAPRNRFHGSGTGTATRYYKVHFDRRGVHPTLDPTMPSFFNFVPLAAPDTTRVELNEVSFEGAGKGALFGFCEAQDGSVRSVWGRNVRYVESESPTYDAIIADCKSQTCDGDCGDVADAVENTYVSIEGVIEGPNGPPEGAYYVHPQTFTDGACDEPGTFGDEICRILQADGRPPQQWSWFERDGGAPFDRYTVTLRSEIFPEFVANDTCLPEDVLGAPLCALTLTEGVALPEPGAALQGFVGLLVFSWLAAKRPGISSREAGPRLSGQG